VTSEEALDALLLTLDQPLQILPNSKSVWDEDAVARLAIERLWITAGNLAESYRIDREIALGIELNVRARRLPKSPRSCASG
jgi:hypothetical protein